MLFGKSVPRDYGRGSKQENGSAAIKPPKRDESRGRDKRDRERKDERGREEKSRGGRRDERRDGREERGRHREHDHEHERSRERERRTDRRERRSRSRDRRNECRRSDRRSDARERSRNRRVRRSISSDWHRRPDCKNKSDVSLSRELRKDLMGKHAFATFSKADFADASRIFWDNGYRTVAAIRDMDSRERDLFLSQTKSNLRGGNVLSDLRIFLKIIGWFEPHGRIRGGLATSFEEIDIDRRMSQWAADNSRISGCLLPDQEMVNFFLRGFREGADGSATFLSIRDNGFPGSPPLATNG